MIAEKKKRKDLDVPAWVREEFAKNNKNDMADLLMHCNWDKARSRIAGRFALTLSFFRQNCYDGVDEFYVMVKESGQHAEEESQEEIRRKRAMLEALSFEENMASEAPSITADFKGLKAHAEREEAEKD
eukprot:s3001_g4.t1